MKIVIEVKDTATLDRIEQLGRFLDDLTMYSDATDGKEAFNDVIKNISKEW